MTAACPAPVYFLLACLAFFGASNGRASQPVHQSCDQAAAKAERDWNVPAGVLSAVGAVESGRLLGGDGASPWPWTINAAGRGAYFESKEQAIAAVLAIMARGYPYIDVGCFQIDIAYHAGVFRSLEEAFDPERNAQSAARILVSERLHAPDWATAVARYHSATPELGGPYLQRVRAALPAAQARVSNVALDEIFESVIHMTNGSATNLPLVVYPPTLPLGRPQPQIVRLNDAVAIVGPPKRD